MAQETVTMKLEDLLQKTVQNNVFKEKIKDKAYKMNATGPIDRRLYNKIAKKSVNIIFTDERKWEQSDNCSNDEITGDHVNNLPVILSHLWGNVVHDTEKEGKNAHILNAAKAILGAILNQRIYAGLSCTISSVKSNSSQRKPFTVFPDILMSLSDKTCRKGELRSPFIAIDYKLPGKLLIFDNSKENLNMIWESRGSVYATKS
ncbi:hypothetical protein RFI_02704 [Reticulomyxa filosa]|uniref:Uncharacterized protein n=1 Tax=Reticulomyxa filosa TaxID=46433 RepID=X6P7A7_RETFI|nr:hypothetical protein RFI_02704 [Reticulomyxa filosa]|eukprot:ETO34390.1 hypothetical protein RFI_02704 [Reticulomyxa filosa]